MQVNIDEYNMEYNSSREEGAAPQPRVVISISNDGKVFGEVHLHKITDLTCRTGPTAPERKGSLVTRSFRIEDASKYYETCAQIVMDYVRRGYEITYLKLI
ncbi:MAG TPA: hypothetical protein VLT35_04610 [Methanocella sp.]|nr:hypothetical protein [Methanocella sp.]